MSLRSVDIFPDSSGIKKKHSVWLTAQVPPCGTVKMSKVIQFCSTAFLIIETSVFNTVRLC